MQEELVIPEGSQAEVAQQYWEIAEAFQRAKSLQRAEAVLALLTGGALACRCSWAAIKGH